MAKTSTRERIRDQLEKTEIGLDKVLQHLYKADVLSQGRQPILYGSIPPILEAIEKVREAIRIVRAAI